MSRSRKPSANAVLLVIADGSNTVVGRFDSSPIGDSDKVTPAATKARQFVESILANQEHVYFEDLKEHGFEVWNDSPEVVKPQLRFTV